MTYLTYTLAKERQADLRRSAHRSRRARQARRLTRPKGVAGLTPRPEITATSSQHR